MALFSAAVGAMLIAHDRETFRTGAQERVRALLTAVDGEIMNSVTTLEALAALFAENEGGPQAWVVPLRKMMTTQADWRGLTVRSPDGLLVAAIDAVGQRPAPADLVDPSISAVAREARSRVGGIQRDPGGDEYYFPVRVPVFSGSRVTHVLTARVSPNAMMRLLVAQQIPADTVGVILDAEQRFVARTVNPEQSVGSLASSSLRDALSRKSAGWFTGSTVEGEDVYTPFLRSAESGWSVAMGFPARTVDAAAWRFALLLGAGLFATVAFALALALWVGRRISRPLAAVAASAEAIAHGKGAGPAPATEISEIRSVAEAVDRAARETGERAQLVAREQAALREADRAKDEFLAVLGHELRNPLAAMTTASYLLKAGGADRNTVQHAQEVIERQAKQMTRLIDDLIEVSRIAAGKAMLTREVFDLGASVAALVADWRAAGRFDGHPLSFSASPAWIDADPARIQQIAVNLLDNALKFTPPGMPVTLRVWQEGGEAVLEVADSGRGIPTALLQRIFDRFVQGMPGTERGRTGLGLGLSLVKQLTEMHGGRVTAHSDGAGQGAVFTVRLPAVPPPQAQLWSQPQAVPQRRLRILVVEDNDDARKMLRAALELKGHTVSEAQDGAGAVAAAAELLPDAAFIDIGLPGFDGYEVARRLRARPETASKRLIAVTGFGQAQDRRRALDAGFDAHLVKPVAIDQIDRVLGALV